MNPKQKKFLWIAGIALAVVYFAPAFINSARQAAYIRQMEAARMAKAQTVQKSSPLPASLTPAPPGAPASLDNLLGVWQGAAPLPGRGMCNLKLELRRSLELGTFSGFPVLLCMPATQLVFRPTNPNALMAQMNPETAILTGTAKDGAMDFHVDRIISKGGSDCELTAFTVTPFGSDQIAAQWKEATCSGGQILLKRLGR